MTFNFSFLGTIRNMSCSDTCTSYNQRTSHFATAWFHLVLAQWNWMLRQKWCQWHGLVSATFILLPLLSRPRDIRYSKMTLACVSLSTIYMLLSQFDIQFCLLVISRKCSITWVTYCVRLPGLTLSPCNLMLELLESTLDWWLFAHIIRYNYWDCLIISFFPSSILNWIAYTSKITFCFSRMHTNWKSWFRWMEIVGKRGPSPQCVHHSCLGSWNKPC